MKKTSLQNRQTSRRKFWLFIFIGAVIAFFFLMAIFKPRAIQNLKSGGMSFIGPILQWKKNVDHWYSQRINLFKEKEEIYNENLELKQQILELQAKAEISSILQEENKSLRALLGRKDDKEFILAAILYRSPEIFCDTLIVDAGSKNGVEPGMRVTAFGNILLGYVTSVSGNTSEIKLISSAGEETNVVFANSNIPATAIGRGGENFEINLPRSLYVNIGEHITTLDTEPLLIGVVEKIQYHTTDPFQKIFFRFPLNIQQLRYVLIIK